MRQDAGQMRQEAFVYRQQALGPYRLAQAVEDALVQVAILVVEAGHDGVFVRKEMSQRLALDTRGMAAERTGDDTYQEDA